MQNPLKRKPSPYVAERNRLLETIATLDPTSPEYKEVLARIDHLDKILKRTSEIKKTVIPTLATGFGVAAIYALQQFGGVLVPKALEAIASRSASKNAPETE
jgi:hypothetical protein